MDDDWGYPHDLGHLPICLYGHFLDYLECTPIFGDLLFVGEKGSYVDMFDVS